MIPREQWHYKGMAGHFFCSDRCKFHLCTIVGDYIISSVGAWYEGHNMQDICCDVQYEIMVFRVEDGVTDFSKELDVRRFKVNREDPFKTDRLVELEHDKMCLKWAEMPTRKEYREKNQKPGMVRRIVSIFHGIFDILIK